MSTKTRAAATKPAGFIEAIELRSLGRIRAEVAELGEALTRLDALLADAGKILRCREDERHGVMADTQIHDDAAEAHFGEEESDGT